MWWIAWSEEDGLESSDESGGAVFWMDPTAAVDSVVTTGTDRTMVVQLTSNLSLLVINGPDRFVPWTCFDRLLVFTDRAADAEDDSDLEAGEI